jgi:hypothetical protein
MMAMIPAEETLGRLLISSVNRAPDAEILQSWDGAAKQVVPLETGNKTQSRPRTRTVCAKGVRDLALPQARWFDDLLMIVQSKSLS